MTHQHLVRLDHPLQIHDIVAVANSTAHLDFDSATRDRIQACRNTLEQSMKRPEPIYGVNTGFGSLSKQRISNDQLGDLQINLLRSHAAGIGDPLPIPVVRAMMALLAASLARAVSGVRPVVIDQIIKLLDAQITPVVPSVGSVGASGDLAPLAHLALVLCGEGRAYLNNSIVDGAEALKQSGIERISLQAKEGLALINGTHLMAARAALLCNRLQRLTDAAVIANAMAIDSCKATDSFLDSRVYVARNQPGPALVAELLTSVLDGSGIITSHETNDSRVQDPYSFRCSPAVLGAAIDTLGYVRDVVKREINAVTDNPLVFDNGDIVSAGNFHGMPIAIPLDMISVAVSHIAGISERRTFWTLAAREAEMELPAYLSASPGLHSGLMIAQYTAAACCNEIIGLANPASVANISTSAGIEDYNSFGPRAAAKADRAVELAERVIAIEMLCSLEGIRRHRPLRSGTGVEQAVELLNSVIPPYDADRSPSPDIEAIASMIRDGTFAEALPKSAFPID
ncbi:MAG: histidine ammonia-lyase [Phycisphaeraceae bacterium]|nr:histidine ammonia-lyase [Phycisphaerales bacterium]MCB9861329.1 histidine ammonia-lyase [Phycisphaeraceae bacterium]